MAVRASLRSVLEKVTLADVVNGTLPAHVKRMTADPDAWVARSRARAHTVSDLRRGQVQGAVPHGNYRGQAVTQRSHDGERSDHTMKGAASDGVDTQLGASAFDH